MHRDIGNSISLQDSNERAIIQKWAQGKELTFEELLKAIQNYRTQKKR